MMILSFMLNKIFFQIFTTLLVFVLFTGCAGVKLPYTKEPAFIKLPPKLYPEFFDDMGFDGLEHGILQSISYLKKVSPEKQFNFGQDSYDAGHLIKSLEQFLRFIKSGHTIQELQKFVSSNYLVYRYLMKREPVDVLFTGYYEPFLNGSLNKTDNFRFPVYALPNDLKTIDLSLFSSKYKEHKIVGRYTDEPEFVPYFERSEIDELNPLEKKAECLAWVNDKIDLFFLEIQGSGIIYLDNGEKINVHYHASNGRPYRAIGKLLIDQEKILREEMSMQKIREYLSKNPEEIQDILNYNPSYIFFKLEEDGPFGCIGVKLTPGRSIALERKLFPSAALAFIEVQKPLLDGDGNIIEWTDFKRFVLNQDTGGAIRGPGRADLFWGNGTYAEIAAGHMRHKGSMYFLVLKPEK